jgi:isoaspartyl peptidase/L-asparaginase-like protein (Ntn-hydrolase superfamily)
MPWFIVATWRFSLTGVTAAAKGLKDNGNCLDAVERVVRMVESDPTVESVGLGGFPNKEGELELDAAIMDGRNLSIGAVAGVRSYLHPVSIARRVMADSPHSFLISEGAEDFAADRGMKKGILLTKERVDEWWVRKKQPEKNDKKATDHDTVAAIALDLDGDMACATSSSGSAMKHQGRVGDSPLVGSGFYVDNEVGGAVATGVGEDIMRGCPCFHAVELMRKGRSPQESADAAVSRIHSRLMRSSHAVGNIAIVCGDNRGNHGAAANHEGFEYAAASSTKEPDIIEIGVPK